MKKIAKELVLLLTFLLLGAIYSTPKAKAMPDPITISWQVFGGDPYGPINGASVEIYYATSNPGPFTKIPDAYVLDFVAGIYRNPIFTDVFNPTYSGMAIAHIEESALGTPSSLWYYAIITLPDSTTLTWPMETTRNRGNPDWRPVLDPDSPSGWAAPHEGVGCGPTTAYLIPPPPPPVIPEVPFGTVVSFLSMFTVLVGFLGVRRFRPKSH
jgi:hypothetical protein